MLYDVLKQVSNRQLNAQEAASQINKLTEQAKEFTEVERVALQIFHEAKLDPEADQEFVKALQACKYSKEDQKTLYYAVTKCVAVFSSKIERAALTQETYQKAFAPLHVKEAWREISSFPLEKLSDEMILAQVGAMDIPELLALAQTSKRLKHFAEDNQVWKALAKRLGIEDIPLSADKPGAIKRNVQAKWQGLSHEILRLSDKEIPEDVKKTLKAQPTVESFSFLLRWAKARNELIVKMIVGPNIALVMDPVSWDSGKKMVEEAESNGGLAKWMEDHSTALQNLTGLNLSSYILSDRGLPRLTRLPPEIGRLRGLQQLLMSGNCLSYLPAEIGHLSALQKLNLGFNFFTTFPQEICSLRALQNLQFEANRITTLPAEIGGLGSLQELYLSRNDLVSLPPEIGHLSALEKLNVENNQLATLPAEFGSLGALRFLILSHNRLTTIPPEVGNLTNLRRFYLDSNHISTLPVEMGNLGVLQFLSLRNNNLTSIPTWNFNFLWNLDLAANQIASLPSEIGRLGPLIQLCLDDNHLTTLPPEVGNLRTLEDLRVSGNQLSSLPAEIANLNQLRIVRS